MNLINFDPIMKTFLSLFIIGYCSLFIANCSDDNFINNSASTRDSLIFSQDSLYLDCPIIGSVFNNIQLNNLSPNSSYKVTFDGETDFDSTRGINEIFVNDSPRIYGFVAINNNHNISFITIDNGFILNLFINSYDTSYKYICAKDIKLYKVMN